MSYLSQIRDEVYNRIGIRQAAEQFSFNDFILEKSWRPWEDLETLFDPDQFPNGKVYVVGGCPSDLSPISRSNAALREWPVMVGIQHAVADIDSVSEIDGYVDFVQSLEDVCRLDVDPDLVPWALSRIEYLKDPNGEPLAFILLRQASLFESYFTAYYSRPLEGYTTTTTT